MSRNFNDFAATLSFYTGPQSSMNSTPAPKEESAGLLSWARSSVDSLNTATSDLLMSRQKLATCGLLIAGGGFCILLSLTFLPLLAIAPRKFATLFTVGSLLILSSFSVLRGHAAFLQHLLSPERLPFSVGYSLSLIGTLYASMWSQSYFLTLVFSVCQIVGLLYFIVSYFPGGAQLLTFVGSSCLAAFKSCLRSSSSSANGAVSGSSLV
jgi:uncharacterized membrane protein